MTNSFFEIQKSQPLNGTTHVAGAKNAVLTIIASLILTHGKSTLRNVPNLSDVHQMIRLLSELGAEVEFNTETNVLTVDTTNLNKYQVNPEIMNKMRASILVMGPLLARFQKANVALPGGCVLGKRPIDFHLKGFEKMGVFTEEYENFLSAFVSPHAFQDQDRRILFEYPSVGATENIMMFATMLPGTTTIVNAAIEPEVLDLIDVLQKMGARVECGHGLFITITGVGELKPVEHTIIPDRIEAGSLLLAAAITGGQIHIPNARPDHMDMFLEKLREMGHTIQTDNGIFFKATNRPRAVNFKTQPYPGFPTDLQAPMIAALCLANGTSEIEETVFDNRLTHTQELQKMGAQITVQNNKAIIRGVEALYGCEVIATDIRASCALVLAGFAAQGSTKMTGLHHWKRGYDNLEHKLSGLGGSIALRA